MKTLQECKEEVAQKYGHNSFSSFKIKCYQEKVHGQMDLIALMDEAAELYAGQFKNIIDAIEEGSNQWKQEYDDSRSILNELMKTEFDNTENEALSIARVTSIPRPTIAVWFSCGVASAVACKKTIEKYGETHNILIVNNPVIEEYEDNTRFLKDVEKWIGLPIIEAKSKEFPSASIIDVFDKRKYISGVHGAPCTKFLKKQARYEFEIENKIDWHVLGFTVDELTRHERFTKFERENVLPILIDENLTKIDCFKIIEEAGIELPKIYKLGYPNANCIGCVKSQSPTYWNLVRETFPDVFEQRSEQSRRIGCKLVKLKGKRVFLDELPIDAKGGKIKSYECGIFCDTK